VGEKKQDLLKRRLNSTTASRNFSKKGEGEGSKFRKKRKIGKKKELIGVGHRKRVNIVGKKPSPSDNEIPWGM